ncbi:FXYD domain-containing ion transport regulator 4-like [Rhynchonycteris naso]
MEGVIWVLLSALAGLPALEANDLDDKDSPFYYDWKDLQLGGMIWAGLLCIVGLLFALTPYLRKLFHSSPQALPAPAEHGTSFVAFTEPAPRLYPLHMGTFLSKGWPLGSLLIQRLSKPFSKLNCSHSSLGLVII